MDEGSHKTALIVGAVAAAAGVAIASYLFLWRKRAIEQDHQSLPLRSVSDLLGDCYTKIREIQTQLTEWNPPSFPSSAPQG